ncbi:MAG: accessory Sec system translocase SecA2, partial [Clostridiaceae bacterium]|nr:accessory Sec system translocase SecA2 [Clostridiaceae bacterium]
MFKKLKNIKNFRKKLREKDLFRFDIKTTRPLIDRINALNFETLGNEEFEEMSRKLACEWKGEIQQEDLLVKAFALAKEAAKRVLGVCPYDVQLMAGIAMLNGNVAQMQTGEGKTLAAVFPAYLNALSGKGVHILTFNDYLAKRDSEWMGPVYDLLGLTVGYINEGMTQEQRKRAYQCDITYATAKEAGFDFLRGFLSMKKEELTQREFNVAIIDEADSILIDEGRIPLVIAGDVGGAESEARRASDIVRSLRRGIHYAKDEYERNVYLTDRGVEVVENMLECGNLYDEENLELLTGINSALHAHVLLKRNVDYIVRNGIVELVDEFTGRVAENRKWPDGLQNAIEAKEGLTGRNTGQIMYSITMQNFIRQYPKICGMTGTAYSAAEEFRDFYGIGVAIIPTHRPCIRVDEPDVVFTHKEAKYKALVKEILRVHKTGRPILIGTCSVDESERIFSELKEAGVNCQVLNVKNDELEAAIIERAGTFGAVTVSTNMAGRGTDIKLGMGDGDEHYKVAVLGGLYVIGTNRHESIRIDNQLRGRAGRQGDPGSTRFFISLEDDLLVKYKITSLIPEKFYPKKQDTPLNDPMIESEIARAQRIIEGQNFDTRKALCKYSIILDEQRR